jgi:hypothetical protein
MEDNDITPAQAEYELYRLMLASQLEKDEAHGASQRADYENLGTEMNRLLREQARLSRSKDSKRRV